MIITSFYSFLLIDLQSYKLFKFMQISADVKRRKNTIKGTVLLMVLLLIQLIYK